MDEDPYTIKYIMKGAPSSNASSSSPYGTLIQEAKFIFHSYSWISFSHTKYKGNKETHNHARFAKRCFRFYCMDGAYFTIISSCNSNDIVVSS